MVNRMVEDDNQSLKTRKATEYRVYEKKEVDASEESVSNWTESERSIKDGQKDDKKMSVAKDEKSLKSLTNDEAMMKF